VTNDLKVLNAYTIGDVVFRADWTTSDGDDFWISVRYAGYNADKSLFFQWRRGSTYYVGAGQLRMPHQSVGGGSKAQQLR
jgi:hypothetical protein